MGNYQIGFVEGRSMTFLTVRQIHINVANTRSQRISSRHMRMWAKTAFLEDKQNCVIPSKYSSSFESRLELRQGDGLPCLLFNRNQGITWRSGLNSRGTIFTRSSQFVCFMDDMDIIGKKRGNNFLGNSRRVPGVTNEKSLINIRKNLLKLDNVLSVGIQQLT